MKPEPRDVIADCFTAIMTDDWQVYDYADRVVRELGEAGFVIRTGLDHERQRREDAALMDLVRRLAATVPASTGRALTTQLDEFQQRLMREATS